MEFVYNLYTTMRDKKIILVYEGEFTQEITKSVLAMTERNLDSMGEESGIKKKVFKVMVECLQNIVKHADDGQELHNDAVFMIGKSDQDYSIITGNYVEKKDVKSLEAKIAQINNLDADGLKALYKEVIRGGSLSNKGGAGLGFIDMARKSGNKLEYSIHDADEFAFFCLKTKINRSADSDSE